MKEIKIRFHHDDKGYCREYWEVFSDDSNKPTRFLIRDTSGPGGTWYIASEEFYEPGSSLDEDITLIVCNHAWEEHMRIANDRNRFPVEFPTVETTCREAWRKFSGKPARCLDTPDFWSWIGQYAPKDLPVWERHNWQNNSREIVKRETLASFDFCGDTLSIIRVTERHTECNLTWYKYFAGSTTEDKYDNIALFYGYEVEVAHKIHEVQGTIISRALLEEYGYNGNLPTDEQIQAIADELLEYWAVSGGFKDALGSTMSNMFGIEANG